MKSGICVRVSEYVPNRTSYRKHAFVCLCVRVEYAVCIILCTVSVEHFFFFYFQLKLFRKQSKFTKYTFFQLFFFSQNTSESISFCLALLLFLSHSHTQYTHTIHSYIHTLTRWSEKMFRCPHKKWLIFFFEFESIRVGGIWCGRLSRLYDVKENEENVIESIEIQNEWAEQMLHICLCILYIYKYTHARRARMSHDEKY